MSTCKNDLEQEFYIKMTKKFGWTINVLIYQMENKSYEKFLHNQTNFDKAVPKKYKGLVPSSKGIEEKLSSYFEAFTSLR
ncbi:MAG: hypothetical protein IPK10_18265 [Bacteroidetes bacterium]|nr:hypothetical protein [Bacteroidota bacterium]